ncbi:hypothetical protein AMEX_G13894 [Astyanax mexicanus]|uniref:Si:dkey-229b18.3 n=2 Tax=Astyanax mexicanus TaxID=7994 RepID=A0A8B9GK88_ASTMX|nr:hypothetical protein AMEX_G13894 [Astyanax mexicanus]
MAGECTYNPQCTGDDTLCTGKHTAGYLNGVHAAKSYSSSSSSSSSSFSSPLFESIGGSMYRKKLEKGCVHYREVLAEDKRLKSIEAFHSRTNGKPHHTLEDTYRLVAEHYWWEGMYFQVRDFVLSCDECHLSLTKRAERLDAGNISRMVRSHSHEVLSKLNSQREAGMFCDITLKTGNGHSFVAHKAVLAAVSEYFQELFTEMDSATDPQPQVDLTGFSEESLLSLLEYCYTSTLTLTLDTLTEVATMARHLRMWHALEVCSVIQREQEPGHQSSKAQKLQTHSEMPGSSSVNNLRDRFSLSGRTVGFKRKREEEPGAVSGPSWNSPMLSKAHSLEGTDESGVEGFDYPVSTQHQSQVLSSLHSKDESFPCSPTRRMKLMDFKSPSSKRKLSPRPSSVISSSPSTSTRSSSPSRRLLRSSPGAALALRRLLPKIDLTTKRKRKCSSYHRIYRAKSDFSSAQYQVTHATPVKIKQESAEDEVRGAVPQDEVHSPRAQEKYRLLSFLGLQRKSLVPGPEEMSGWGQKKRLRKLKVSDYSLTTRRKPRAQGIGGYASGLGEFVGVSSSLSLCDMTRMDLLKKVIKSEPQEAPLDRRMKRKRDAIGQMEPLSIRTTRSQSSLQADSKASPSDRPLRRQAGEPSKPLGRPPARDKGTVQGAHAAQKKATLGKVTPKREPTKSVITSQPAVTPTKTKSKPVGKKGPPVERQLRITATKSKRTLRYDIAPATTKKCKSTRLNKPVKENTKHSCNRPSAKLEPQQTKVGRRDQVHQDKKNMARGVKRMEEKAKVLQGARSWSLSSTNHQHYHNNPLYKTIKEEPADPLPLTQPFPTTDVSDLGKRQSKPPVKLLDQGFLFGLCRPPGGIKREDESVDICLTRSFSHSSAASPSNTSPDRRDRIAARLMPDRTGLNGPHWAGLGSRSPPFSQRTLVRVKKEEEEGTRVSQRSKVQQKSNKSSTQHKVSKKNCKVKREPPKTKNVKKLYPKSSRRTVILESIRRVRLKQMKGARSSGVHSCLQCRASYRDCDSLLMHRMRHIEGKHWPCPLCSKTFFRQKNVRSHIRTHNPSLYKCRQCISAS